MATKSIYKDIRIKNCASCNKFLSALENAKGKAEKDVVMTKKVQKLSIEKISGFLKFYK